MWTEETLAHLRILAACGLHTPQIADALNTAFPSAPRSYTKNAVISACHRRNIKLKPCGHPTAERKRSCVLAKKLNLRPPPIMLAPATPAAPAAGATPATPVSGVPFHELKPQSCRWPFGNPGEDNFVFCGCQQMKGSSYCDHHARMARVSGKVSPIRIPAPWLL